LRTRTGYFLEIRKHTEIGSVEDVGREIADKIGGIDPGLKSCSVDIFFKVKNNLFCLDVFEFFSRYFTLSRTESDLQFREFLKEDYFWLSRELYENRSAGVSINHSNHVSIQAKVSLLNVNRMEFNNQYLVEKSPEKTPGVRIDLLPGIDAFPGKVLTDPRGVVLLLEAARKIEERFKRRY
jgi:hypothetical protein